MGALLKNSLRTIQYDAEREELIFYVGENVSGVNLKREAFKRTPTGASVWHLRNPYPGKSQQVLKYIAQPFRRQFTKRSLYYGSASNGRRPWQRFGPLL